MGKPASADESAERVALDVLDNLLEGCQVIGFDWRYLYVNDAVVAHGRTARQRLLGRTMMECYPGIEATPMFAVLRRCMSERARQRMENEFTYPDGSKGWFELRFVPVPEGTCILSLDVTEAKRAAAALASSERQLRQAQKLEAVGRLAGGVAHDFNNMLSVILSYAATLLGDCPPSDPMRAELEEIQKAGERAADLTRRLLAFSRQQVLEPRVLDLNQVLAGTEKLIRRLVGEDVQVRLVRATGLRAIRVDPGHLEQVVMNLVVNARDAMPGGGTLTVETQNVELDAAYAERHLGTAPGPHVMLAVSDTGVGMDTATQERMFEPFFTTKEQGKGTGLGLSTALGIVQQSGGSIWVYSEPGQGTTFKVYFPVARDAEVAPAAPVQVATVRGSETVLLVEDEDQVRRATRAILERHGYQVLEARSGEEGLSLSAARGGAVHLLLTDAVMPGMNGRELAERLAPVRAEMRVLYMSGYTPDAIAPHHVLPPGTALLQKPITPESLLRKVREVLDAPSAPRGRA